MNTDSPTASSPCEPAAVFAVDLGGTHIKAAVVTADGTVEDELRSPAREHGGVEAWSAAAVETARQALAAHSGPVPAALGLSVPGAVDTRACTLVDLVARLPSDQPVALDRMFAPLGLSAFADNDARAALAAERRWGLAQGVDSVVVFTVGTGLGGAAVIDGRPPSGDRLLAGIQLGHLSIDPSGPRCVCGNVGCVELWASGPGIVRMAAEEGLPGTDVTGVLAAAGSGDPAATRVLDRFNVALATAVVNAIHAYQPDLVVLAGGVLAAAPHLVPAVRDLVAERAWTVPRGRIPVQMSPLAGHGGVLGAAAVAYDGLAASRHRRG